MTTNDPKVFGIIDKHRASGILLIMHGHDSLKDGDKLIRLTDHESARAADKARIAELEAALSECAASLAWNCFGECRAVHDGPIMPAQPYPSPRSQKNANSNLDCSFLSLFRRLHLRNGMECRQPSD